MLLQVSTPPPPPPHTLPMGLSHNREEQLLTSLDHYLLVMMPLLQICSLCRDSSTSHPSYIVHTKKTPKKTWLRIVCDLYCIVWRCALSGHVMGFDPATLSGQCSCRLNHWSSDLRPASHPVFINGRQRPRVDTGSHEVRRLFPPRQIPNIIFVSNTVQKWVQWWCYA